MRDPQDQIELRGIRIPPPPPPGGVPRAQDAASNSGGRKWKSVWFRCCHVYGRMYRNQTSTAYIGHCPRCGARVSARIGPGGTNRRMFEAG